MKLLRNGACYSFAKEDEVMNIVVVYDGTVHAKTALRYGIRKAKEGGGRILVLHVFNNALFIDYGAGPNAEKAARDEAARHFEEAKKIVHEEGAGIAVRLIEAEGQPEELITGYARDEKADLILAPPAFHSIGKRSPCPVSIIPGIILVPVDSSDSALRMMDRIVDEATATRSRVILLGIVPVHIYSSSEKNELEAVKKQTSLMVKKAGKTLGERNIETSEMIRSGYPDEEILKTAAKHNVSMILMPSGGDSPSELSKAASIIMEERDVLASPLLVVSP
jgi:nucleotide-binding universal stress UspA family protein